MEVLPASCWHAGKRATARRRRYPLALILVVALPAAARGDYLSDRRTQRQMLRSGPQILRLYIGKRSINDCSRRLDDCLRRNGEPDERRRVSADEEHLIYRGTKILYRGTGVANEAVGPEWREYVVRGGQVRDQFSAVQVIETGYPWRPTAGVEKSCEVYGSANTIFCIGVTELGPVPAMPPPAKKPFDYGCAPGAREPGRGDRGIPPIDPQGFAFANVVADEIHAVLGRDRFRLTRGAPRRPENEVFILGQDLAAGARTHELDATTRTCALSTRLNLGFESTGALVVGVCDRTTELTWDDVCWARSNFTTIALSLGLDPTEPTAAKFGMIPSHERLGEQLEADYVPVLLVGHGIGMAPMVILTSADTRYAVGVQLQADNLCGRDESNPLCSEPARVLTDLAVRVARRVQAR